MHHQGVQFYLNGINLRRIGRLPGVDHMTVAAWIRQHTDSLPTVPGPQDGATTKQPELFTFIAAKGTSSTS